MSRYHRLVYSVALSCFEYDCLQCLPHFLKREKINHKPACESVVQSIWISLDHDARALFFQRDSSVFTHVFSFLEFLHFLFTHCSPLNRPPLRRQSLCVPHRGLSTAHHQPQLRGQRAGGTLQHARPGAQGRLHRPGHVSRRHEGVDRRLPQVLLFAPSVRTTTTTTIRMILIIVMMTG